MADNTTATWRFLRGKGLSPAQAAGVIGSMQGESGPGLDPAAVNPNGGATGIAQWLGGRKTAAVQTKQLGPQLNHLWHELQTSERGALSAIKVAHTPEQAAIAWQRGFERGAPFEQKYNLRASNARKVFNRLSGVPGSASSGAPAQGRAASAQSPAVTTPGVDNSDARRQALSSFLLGGQTDPVTGQQSSGDILDFALQMKSLQDTPGTTTPGTTTPRSTTPQTPGTTTTPQTSGSGGALSALSWAQSKIGEHEFGGANQGGIAGYLNKQFGMSGAPWCAMFTSTAVTKGGAPPSARTASVAQVRQKAQQGVGYHRGFIPGHQAQPGDLILFGTSHIGMVKSNSGGHITYVGGNQSDAVTTGQVPAGGATIVRPKYGAR